MMSFLRIASLLYLTACIGISMRGNNLEPNLNYTYPEIKYFEQKLDHFNPTINNVFLQRYLISTEYWDGNGGPILFYTGNEGDITLFVNNTGLMWDIAPELKAMVIFAEHRYYGKSKPYPDINPTPDNVHKFGQFTVEQALADYARLIMHLKLNIEGASNSPVIAFGGSYGGMLAAWLRQKYPHIVDGALAASAPVRFFPGLVHCDAYYNVVTNDFHNVTGGSECVDNIRRSWSTIEKTSMQPGGYEALTKVFHLCKPLKNLGQIESWLENAWTSLSMVDYPYATNFLNPLPGWPIKETCWHLTKPGLQGPDLLNAIRDAAGVFYNYTGKFECFSMGSEASPGLSASLWDYQTCTEMVMPFCANGVQDMFKQSNWSINSFTKSCQKKYGTTPRPVWPIVQFGSYNLRYASNIVFSNGDLDPWKVGGVLEADYKNIVAITIENAAHHLDLRHANYLDPKSVRNARRMELEYIATWIDDNKKHVHGQ